ncbi:MAG: HypC/HybG/HupF family hydrogenase formation chaperone [Candidatus Diapherotrites archaeon]
MCLAVPGKIISIENSIATVDYGSEKRRAKIVVGDYHIGDFVLVQAKLVVEKIPREQVQAWLDVVRQNET